MVRQQAMHPILGALQGISRPAQGTTSRASLYAQKPQLGGGTQYSSCRFRRKHFLPGQYSRNRQAENATGGALAAG